MPQDQGQITDQFTSPQIWTSNVPGKYGVTMQNRASPNTSGAGNVGGEAQEWLDSTGKSIGTMDDRGFSSSRIVGGVTGEVKLFPLPKSMSGFLLCDGSPVSRTTYADLFAYLSTTFGVGDGTTTFNLPKYQDVALAGIGPTQFTAPQTVYGSNAPVNLQHAHTGDVHTHPTQAHNHPTHTHTTDINHDHPNETTNTQLQQDPSTSRGVANGSGTQVSHQTHNHGFNTNPLGTQQVTSSPVAAGVNVAPPDTLAASAANTGLAGPTSQSVVQATMGLYAYIKT